MLSVPSYMMTEDIDALLELSDLVAEYAPNYISAINALDGGPQSVVNSDGKLFSMCVLMDHPAILSGFGLVLRQDWMEELGVSAPETYDDYHDLLLAIKDTYQPDQPLRIPESGAFFCGQDVAVVGGGNTALEDALYLSGICSTVHLLVRKNEFRGQAALVQRVMEKENIKVCFQTEVTEILGDSKVSGITVTQDGVTETIPLSGVFIAIGLSPDTSLYGDLVETDPSGYIVAGEDCRTSVPGIFAAGDIRTKEIRQIVTALADGAVAAELAGRELS